jgi:hypothetical protein
LKNSLVVWRIHPTFFTVINTQTINMSCNNNLITKIDALEKELAALRSVASLSEAKPSRSLTEMEPAERVALKGQELRDRHAVLAGKKLGRKHSSPFDSKAALIAEILRLESLLSAPPHAPAPSPASEPEKPKREINSKIAAMNEQRMAILAEMRKGWEEAHPSFASMDKDELKKAVALGLVPKRPSLPDALKEHSRRMRAVAPLHDKKAQFRRDALDLLQTELKPVWIASGKKGREPSEWFARQELKRRRAQSEPKITQVTDPEIFDKILEINGNKFALNSLNWVIDGNKEWVGLWDPVKKVIDITASEPTSDDE